MPFKGMPQNPTRPSNQGQLSLPNLDLTVFWRSILKWKHMAAVKAFQGPLLLGSFFFFSFFYEK